VGPDLPIAFSQATLFVADMTATVCLPREAPKNKIAGGAEFPAGKTILSCWRGVSRR
jgi:hypothetical protein